MMKTSEPGAVATGCQVQLGQGTLDRLIENEHQAELRGQALLKSLDELLPP